MRCGNAVAADRCAAAAHGLADWAMAEPLLAQKRCAASAEMRFAPRKGCEKTALDGLAAHERCRGNPGPIGRLLKW